MSRSFLPKAPAEPALEARLGRLAPLDRKVKPGPKVRLGRRETMAPKDRKAQLVPPVRRDRKATRATRATAAHLARMGPLDQSELPARKD